MSGLADLLFVIAVVVIVGLVLWSADEAEKDAARASDERIRRVMR